MRGRRCTIDSSCLIALECAGLIPSLSILFNTVLVPKAVRGELFKRRATKDRLRVIHADYEFFEWCEGYDQGAVDVLLLERNRRGMKDRGEAEAIAQASQLGATVIMDDLRGRELANHCALECHGTLWVLEQLHNTGIISSNQVRGALNTMRDHGIRLPPKNVDSFLARIGQEPLLLQ